MPTQDAIERLRAEGILAPRAVVAEAKRAGLRLELACALLQKESSGGHNVFGHDPTIFVGAGEVTRERYMEYKRRRVASNNRLMQGVGPCQLTWWEFQDTADKEGGCWRPEINMRVGFRHLAALIRTHGESDGARRYNGSGPAAVAYSKDLLARAAAWSTRLEGAAPVVVPDGPGPLRRGDRGAKVVRLTRRLSRVRSSRTGRPYLDAPRRELDTVAEAALKAFQAEHRLEADGVFGPLSQRKLNRVLRLQAEEAPAPAPAPAKPRRATLRSLVAELHRLDAETGEAWEALVARAAHRRRLLERAQAQATADEPATTSILVQGFAAVTSALKEIDGSLDTLVAQGQEGAAAAAGTAPAPAADVAAGTSASTGTSGAPAADVAAGAQGTGAPAAAAGGMPVIQAPPPPVPPADGPNRSEPKANGAFTPPAARRRELVELSDQELLERIERLDLALDRSRAVLIRRYAEVEKDLARLAPQRTKPAVKSKPVVKPRPKPAGERKPPTAVDVRALQEDLNRFTDKRLKLVGPLIVDGVAGPATKKRIRLAKYYLGYTGKARRSAAVDEEFLSRLRRPRSARRSGPAMLFRALDRRRKQRRAAKASAAPRAGVATFDGRPVAAWLKPYLVWARNNGWRGTLNSGWRDPAYSEKLCVAMCGAPSCPGRCAGRSSNHAGNIRPAGALDVSDYATFGELMRRCPLSPRIFNALGARDPVHFSASGR